jgi:hypothetical protein
VTVPEGESFADGVAEALARGALTDGERLAFIDANSWQRRHDDLLNVALGADGIASRPDGGATVTGLVR